MRTEGAGVGSLMKIPGMILIAILVFCSSHHFRLNAQDLAFTRKGDICVIDLDGSNLRKIARDPKYGLDRPIGWMANGKELLYWRHDSPGWRTWKVNIESLESELVLKSDKGGVRCGVFSPDGKQIAYNRDAPEGVYVCKSDGTKARPLSEIADRDKWPSWSADSRFLVFPVYERGTGNQARRGWIWIGDTRTMNSKRLTAGIKSYWCQISNRIYLIASVNGTDQIFFVTFDRETTLASKPTQVTNSEWDIVDYRVSPDGKRIAFLRSKDRDYHLFVYDWDDQSEIAIQKNLDWSTSYDWSPDGNMLVYSNHHAEQKAVILVEWIKGKSKSKKIFDGPAHYLRWNPKYKASK